MNFDLFSPGAKIQDGPRGNDHGGDLGTNL
jgi:hypothetical protein